MRRFSEEQVQMCQGLHLRARLLSCAYYLRVGTVPSKLKRILSVTRSLNQLGKYNPDWASQPCVPSGNPGGGQWTSGGGSVPLSSPFVDVEIHLIKFWTQIKP